jgi:hypothetical protein
MLFGEPNFFVDRGLESDLLDLKSPPPHEQINNEDNKQESADAAPLPWDLHNSSRLHRRKAAGE